MISSRTWQVVISTDSDNSSWTDQFRYEASVRAWDEFCSPEPYDFLASQPSSATYVSKSHYDIAEAVHYAVSQPAHVDIQDMLVMPTAQASGTFTGTPA